MCGKKTPSETQSILPLVICTQQSQKQTTPKSEIQVLKQKNPLDIGYDNRNEPNRFVPPPAKSSLILDSCFDSVIAFNIHRAQLCYFKLPMVKLSLPSCVSCIISYHLVLLHAQPQCSSDISFSITR